MRKDTAKTDFGLHTRKQVLQQKIKPRRIKFEADGWYETATRSISIAKNERGPRISSQWITASHVGTVDDYD